MGRAMEDGKTSVAQSYIQYGWLETGATPIEEKIVDYSILCICQDPQKGYREFKEIPDNKRFLKRVVEQVYSKDPQNVSKILDIFDLIDDLEQKLTIIWALFDQIMLNDDNIGAKSCLAKLKEIKVLIDGNGNFSEFDLWQIKLMDHLLGRLQLSVQNSSAYNTNDLKTFIHEELSTISTNLESFIGDKHTDSLSKLESFIDEKFENGRKNEMKEILDVPLPVQTPAEKLLGKTFEIRTENYYCSLCSEKYSLDTITIHRQLHPKEDIWILEKFPNQSEQTFYIKKPH